MDPSLWRRLEPILDRALDLAGAARSAYLQAACAGDPALGHATLLTRPPP